MKIKSKPVKQAEVARRLNMTRQSLNELVKLGMPLDSMDAALAWYEHHKLANGIGSRAPQTLNDARTRKVNLECEALELRVAIQRGEYLPVAEIEETMVFAASVFSGSLRGLVNDLPAMLVGLDEKQIKVTLVTQFDRLVNELKENLENGVKKAKRKSVKVDAVDGEGASKPKARKRAGVGRGARKATAQRSRKKL